MTSTKLSDSVRADVLCEIEKHLDRLITFVPCEPRIDATKFFYWWHSKLPPDYVEAFACLESYDYNLSSENKSEELWINLRDRQTMIRVPRGRWTKPFLAAPQSKKQRDYVLSYWNRREEIFHAVSPRHHVVSTTDEFELVFPGITEWSELAIAAFEEVRDARNTARQILSIMRSAGQLMRAVPDLMKYLPTEKRAAFANQKRASSMPYEWAAFDRVSVERLQNALGKALLLQGVRSDREQLLRFKDTGDNIAWAYRICDAEGGAIVKAI